MAYGVDSYGRPLTDGMGGAPPPQQQQQQNSSNPTRQDNTAPQQQGQQPAQQSQYGSNTGITGGAQGSYQPQGQGMSAQQPQQQQAQGGYGSPQDAIAQLYAQHGVQDGGAGSGFTDAAYWAKQSAATGGWNDYWNNRLNADLSGTGTDAGGNNAAQYQTQAAPQGQWQQYTAGQLPNAPQNFQYDTGGMPTYQAGQLSTQGLPAYMAAQLAQYQQPSQADGLNKQMGGMVGQLLASPNSMSDQNVAQLNEQNKEQALGMQQQQLAQSGQAAAANGTYGSGQMQANDQRSRENALNTVLSGNRSTALQKMVQDRTDQLNALSTGQNFTQGLTSQALGNYGAQLQGQQAQAGQNLTQQQSQAAQVQYNLQRQQAQEQLNQAQAASQQAAQQYQFQVQQAQNASNVGQQQYGLQQALAQQGLYQQSAQINNQSMQAQLAAQLAQAGLAQQGSFFDQNLANNQYQFGVNNANHLNGF